MLHLRSRMLRYTLLSTVALLPLLLPPVQASRSTPSQAPESRGHRMFEGLLSQELPENSRTDELHPLDDEGVCWVAPFTMPDTARVWSDRPTFTWQSPEGMITRLEVQPSDDRHPPLSYPISVEHRVRYISTPTYQITLEDTLEPGVTYEWRMYRPVPFQPELEERLPRVVQFEVMEGEERDRMAMELAEIEQDGIEQGYAPFFERGLFFERHGLMAEVWQIMVSELVLDEIFGSVTEGMLATQVCEEPTQPSNTEPQSAPVPGPGSIPRSR